MTYKKLRVFTGYSLMSEDVAIFDELDVVDRLVLYKQLCASPLPPSACGPVASTGQWTKAEVTHVLPGGAIRSGCAGPSTSPVPGSSGATCSRWRSHKMERGTEPRQTMCRKYVFTGSCWISGDALPQEVNHHCVQNSG